MFCSRAGRSAAWQQPLQQWLLSQQAQGHPATCSAPTSTRYTSFQLQWISLFSARSPHYLVAILLLISIITTIIMVIIILAAAAAVLLLVVVLVTPAKQAHRSTKNVDDYAGDDRFKSRYCQANNRIS